MILEAQPIINIQCCTRCGQCISGCPKNALEMGAQSPVLRQPSRCTYCADCEALCPEGAIRVPFIVAWEPDPTPLNKNVK